MQRNLNIAGLLGTTMFYADSVLTPAVSVLSALEGIAIASPALAGKTMPIGLIILVLLFMVQRFGTGIVGRLFGPLIVLWFLALGITGVQQIVLQPAILAALNPMRAVEFLIDQSARGELLTVLGYAVLGVTGGECLYADLGHFGPLPVRLSWALVTLPGLVLNYLGQGALLMRDPSKVSNPFYYMFPDQFLYPAVALSTIATTIASQAVISGAYSMSCEAMKMGFLPRMEVLHTSKSKSGQIYVPAVNTIREIPYPYPLHFLRVNRRFFSRDHSRKLLSVSPRRSCWC
jgi:KUP system potassium uptake protein